MAKPPKRGKDNATLTISLPKTLKDRIAAAAQAENRSISNWCVWHLDNLLQNKARPLLREVEGDGNAEGKHLNGA
jgi:hypothetical protein